MRLRAHKNRYFGNGEDTSKSRVSILAPTDEDLMNSQNYSRTILTCIPADEAFNKIGRVSDWWNKSVRGLSQKLGDTFTVDFGQTFVDFKIVELVPGKKVVWLVTNCNLHWIDNKTEWNGTSVAWDISSADGMTTVQMVHRGLTPREECFEFCQTGWDFYIGESLLELLNTNKGRPDGRHRDAA